MGGFNTQKLDVFGCFSSLQYGDSKESIPVVHGFLTTGGATFLKDESLSLFMSLFSRCLLYLKWWQPEFPSDAQRGKSA